MANLTTPKIGFVGWNPFQLLHVRKLIKALPGACFVLEKRKDFINEFSDDLLNDPSVPVIVWKHNTLIALDGVFDVLVCQTEFKGIESFVETQIAMIQYGYAKEAHNYGTWRSLANLNLAFGPYAARKIGYFSPTVASGNPRYDDWFDSDFHSNSIAKHMAGLDPNKRTVLYAPTWGDLSSIDVFLGAVYDLADQFNVLLKMHHNTHLLEPGRKQAMKHQTVRHLGANEDLLELMTVSDIVISDYSGAIFDAVFCKKPLILLNVDIDQTMGKKLDEHSLEYMRRDEIGLQVDRPHSLRDAVLQAAQASDIMISKSASLRAELFTDQPGATERAASALLTLAEGNYVPDQMHSYVRKQVIELAKVKTMLAAANKKLKG